MLLKRSSDSYQVECSYVLDEYRRNCLYNLYQPVLGCDAVSLYMTLYYQNKLDPSLLSSLYRTLGLTSDRINNAFDKLEAVGLLKSYYKEDTSQFIFKVLLPIPPGEFFKHKILNTMLSNVMRKEEYLKCKSQFYHEELLKDDFKNTTVNFSDVIDVTTLHSKEMVSSHGNFFYGDDGRVEDQYHIDLFYENLNEYQIPKKFITPDTETTLKQLGMLYQVGVLDLLVIVKRCCDKNSIDLKAVAKACQDHYDLKMPTSLSKVHHTQSVVYKSMNVESSMEEHVKYLETISPYNLLKKKYGGKEPVKRELMIIENFLTTQGVEPGVMNVLIEYTLAQCDGALPRSFMEYHVSKWQRKKINTVNEAIKEAKNTMNKEVKDEPKWSSNTVSTTPNDEELDIDAFMKKYD